MAPIRPKLPVSHANHSATETSLYVCMYVIIYVCVRLLSVCMYVPTLCECVCVCVCARARVCVSNTDNIITMNKNV